MHPFCPFHKLILNFQLFLLRTNYYVHEHYLLFCPMQLRIRMPSGIQKYEVKITERLFSLREEIAKRESVTADRVTMFYNDTAIHSDDSVQSLGESTFQK